MPHHHQHPPHHHHGITKRHKSNEFLNKTVMNYYLQHGQDRGFEKYLHLRRSNESLPATGCSLTDLVAKSMENISALKSTEEEQVKAKAEAILLKQRSKSAENLAKVEEQVPPPLPAPSKEDPLKNINISITQNEDNNAGSAPEGGAVGGKEKKKKKNFNFNVESHIQLNVPPTIPPFTFPFAPSQPLPLPAEHKASVETQTTLARKAPEESPPSLPPEEEPIKPVFSDKAAARERDVSPASSVASASKDPRQALEWDSMADIGYEAVCDQSELSELERKALRRYFAARGLDYDRNIVVLKSTPAKDRKEKWAAVFTKYKNEAASQTSIRFDTPPDAQSTPKAPSMGEKSAQTSIVKILSKGVQVEPDEGSSVFGAPSQVTPSEGEAVDVGSFEFLAGSTRGRRGGGTKSSKSSDSVRQKVQRLLDSRSATASSSKTTSSSSEERSAKQETTGCSFDEELRMAIALMNSVLESKTMQTALKRSLVAKIIQKIANLQANDGEKSGSRTASGSKSNSSESKSDSKSTKSKLETKSNASDSGKDSKTKSATPKSVSKRSESEKSEDSSMKSMICHEDVAQEEPMTSNKGTPVQKDTPEDSLDSVVKDCLKPMTHSEVDYQNRKRSGSISRSSKSESSEKEASSNKGGKSSQLLWIEKEIDQLNNLKRLLIEAKSQNDSSQKSAEPVFVFPTVQPKIYENIRKQPEEPEVAYKNLPAQPAPPQLPPKATNSSTDNSSSAWDSHGHTRHAINAGRTRLQTPAESEASSIVRLIDERRAAFARQYERACGRLYAKEEPLYTKPYSDTNHHHHYSRPRPPPPRRTIVIRRETTKPSATDAATSVSSSEVFSSGSISVPETSTNRGGGQTTTTTHVYDLKSADSSGHARRRVTAAVETQTTDSVAETEPIFGAGGKTKSTATTLRISRRQSNKLQQTTPRAIAYVLTFEEPPGEVPLEKGVEEERRGRKSAEAEEDASIRSAASSVPPLTQYLSEGRPAMWTRMEQRNYCIKELRRLRDKRNEQRKKLLLLTSDESLREKMKKMPPAPLDQKRLFTTKAIKLHTQKQYRNLPEVVRKKEIEKINNLKKKNRLMTDIFNRNLQRKVLTGQTDLSNSVNLICNG